MAAADTTSVELQAPAEPGAGACANCGTPLTGEFCSRCGQRNKNLAVSLLVLARDFADEYLSFDSRLFRSILALVLRPGHLTRQYLLGRRMSYVRPLRLYLVTSLVFFFALSLIGRPVFHLDGTDGDAPIRELLRQATDAEREATTGEPAQPSTTEGEPGTGPVAAEGPSPESTDAGRGGSILGLSWGERLERLGSMSPRQLTDALVSGLERTLPRTMFVLLPVFALILKGLYARGRWFYAEHFVFALHFHAFLFAVFLALLVVPGGWVRRLFLLWIVIYLIAALHTVYRQSIWKTGLKFALLTSVYYFVLLVAILASVALTLILI